MDTRRSIQMLTVVLVIALFTIPASGCSRNGAEPNEPAPAPTPAPEPAPEPEEPVAETQSVLVYLLDGEKLTVARRPIDDTAAAARAAMEELLGGPEGLEVELGYTSEIPAGTALGGVTVENRLATVDLSPEFESGGGSLSMTMRVAQVVYTLTQFESVDAVAFRIDGNPVEAIGGEGIMVDPPVTRGDFADNALPAIFIESPAPGDDVTSSVRLTGISNTFEATFIVNVVDQAGLIVLEDFVTATAGSGTWGTFDVTFDWKITREGMGSLIVWEESAEDGSQLNLKEIPLFMTE